MNVEKSRLDELRIHRDPEPGRAGRGRGLWAVVTVALLAVAAIAWWRRPKALEVQAEVAVAQAAGASATVLNASGYVTARRQATVSSKMTGKVVEVLVEEGMRVDADQVLARLDASTAGPALSLAEANAEAAARTAEAARAEAEEARLDFTRVENMVKEGVASASDLDRARSRRDAAVARAAADTKRLEASRRAAELGRQDLRDTEIRAPFAGVVISKNAQPGEMISPVSAGGGFTRTGICTIVDMSSLEIEVDVNEAYITRVSAGQPVEAVLDAYPDWKIAARVVAIIPAADRQKATVRVRIGFDALDPRILPDMGVKVAFIQADTADAAPAAPQVTVPRSALRQDGEQDIVFIVENGRAVRRAVQVGSSEGNSARIGAGLRGGETVITAAPEGLADGARVRVVKEGK